MYNTYNQYFQTIFIVRNNYNVLRLSLLAAHHLCGTKNNHFQAKILEKHRTVLLSDQLKEIIKSITINKYLNIIIISTYNEIFRYTLINDQIVSESNYLLQKFAMTFNVLKLQLQYKNGTTCTTCCNIIMITYL